jgi:hypothetical protein
VKPKLLASLSIVLFVVLDVTLAVAQPVLERVVGLDPSEQPVTITRIDGQTIGTLARASGVPMGFEGLQPSNMLMAVVATKRSLRDVLDEMVAADRRYEWREDDGVIVVRPVEAWNDQSSSFNRPIDGITLQNVTATDLFPVLTRIVGVRVVPTTGLADTKRMSLQIANDSTLLSALNAMVRAHGILSWSVEPSRSGDRAFPTTLSLFVGSAGLGFGVSASARMQWAGVACCAADSVSAPTQPHARAAAGVPNRAVATGPGTGTGIGTDESSRFERIVGSRPNGLPIVARGVADVLREVAASVHVIVGFEALGVTEEQVPNRPGFDGVKLTGMTLQEALTVLVTLDPRYQWYDVDGVIVFRPVTAWLDPASPLVRAVDGIQMEDATMAKVIGEAMLRLGEPDHRRNTFPDSRTFSLNLPRGSVLEMLNGIVRAHGEVSWEWHENQPEDRKLFGGRRFSVHFSLRGSGQGFAIP